MDAKSHISLIAMAPGDGRCRARWTGTLVNLTHLKRSVIPFGTAGRSAPMMASATKRFHMRAVSALLDAASIELIDERPVHEGDRIGAFLDGA